MCEVEPLADLGLELWVLVYHLYGKHRDVPSTAFRELTLRTRCALRGSDVPLATSPMALRETAWFRAMSDRWLALRHALRAARAPLLAEVHDVTRSLYPSGCGVAEYADALQTCAAMLTLSIPRAPLARYAATRAAALRHAGGGTVSADDIARDLFERPLLDAATPPRWWETDGAPTATCAAVRAVGANGRPPALAIAYTAADGARRVRRIRVAGLLHELGPVAPLAKRLAASHGALLGEEVFQRHLQRLQRLMAESRREDRVDRTEAEEQKVREETSCGNGDAGDEGRHEDKSHPLNKADVGLLYRDPEAALADVDLNDADDVTLKEFKAKMEEKFVENAVRPGDAQFVYDKRIEVKPTQRSEWDDSD